MTHPNECDTYTDLGKRLFKSGSLLLLSRLVTRVLQLIRMVTIARWLGPQEMGVYAVATLVLMTLEQFSETGLRSALIQRQEDISLLILPVRTVQAVRGLLIGLGLFLIAPFLASFFNSPNSLNILRVMSLLPVINGFEPLFLVLSQKELYFAPVVALQLTASSISLIVGVIAAYFRPNAWALVVASLTGAIITTTGAHFLSKGRDLGFTFNWRSLEDIRNFGFWIFMTTIMAYVFTRAGDWMIGRLIDVETLAFYQMSFIICSTVTGEIATVASKLSFPLFSRLQIQMQRLRFAFRTSFGTISILTLCSGGVVIACAQDFYLLVLGEKWLPALPFVPWLTVWGVCGVFAMLQSSVFKAMNNPRTWTITVVFMTLFLVTGLYPMTHWFGARGVAILIAFIGVSMQLVRYRIIAKMLHMAYADVLMHVLAPTFGCVLSIFLINNLRAYTSISNSLLGLIFNSVFFLIFYFFFLRLFSRWIYPSPRVLWQKVTHLLPF